MTKVFYEKAKDLLKTLKIETKFIKTNEDILKAKNFSAIIIDKSK